MNWKTYICGVLVLLCMSFTLAVELIAGNDLPDIKERGVLRHLGVPYAKFVTGSGDGLDVELMKLFADYLEVDYQYVETDWQNVIADLTGQKVKPSGEDIEILADAPIRGDVIANGLTILPWREKALDYSDPTFPSGVWLIARAESTLQPITPSGDIKTDIAVVKKMLQGRSVLTLPDTCLDSQLYKIDKTGAEVQLFNGMLNELAPAVLRNEAETSLLDVPDALVALEKWPGQIKVLGPVSHQQKMACGFAKSAPQLRAAFNRFFEKIRQDGTYLKLLESYYPIASVYFPGFFNDYIVEP
ncbi:MAG: transporter substrate-binding domain-containing protein [Desulforhopalus sp.]